MSVYDLIRASQAYTAPTYGSGASALATVSRPPRQSALDRFYSAPQSAPRQPVSYLPQEQKADMLADMRRGGMGALSTIGMALDTPGAIFRGILAGDPASGFTWDDDRRVTGKELLEQYGFIDKKTNPYASTVAGFAAEVALDPTNMIFGPLRALSAGGKAVKYAGLLDKAGDAALARIGLDEAARRGLTNLSDDAVKDLGVKAAQNTMTGAAASRFLRSIAPRRTALSPENISIRPLVGPRKARMTATVEDVVNTASDAAERQRRITALDNYLSPRGLSYAEVKGQTLSNSLGLGYLTPMAGFNLPGAGVLADALDAAGQAARWSAPIRFGSQLFDKRVGGKFDAGEQLFSIRAFNDLSAAAADDRAKTADYLLRAAEIQIPDEAAKMLGTRSLASAEAAGFMRRFMEGVQTQSDEVIASKIGKDKIDDLVGRWRSMNDDAMEKARAAGIPIQDYNDPYGGKYSPRAAREANFGEYGTGGGRATYSANLLENESRQWYLKTPGLTQDLTEASLLPTVRRFVAAGDTNAAMYTREELAAMTDAARREAIAAMKETRPTVSVREAGKAIKDFLQEKHGPGAKDPRVVPFKTKVKQLDADGNVVMEPVLDAGGKPRVNPKTGLPRMRPVYTDEVISQKQAEKIARFFQRKDKVQPGNVGMFSEHPLVAQSRTIKSLGRATANAKFAVRHLAEMAMRKDVRDIKGINYQRLDNAITAVARKIGLETDGGAASDAVQTLLKEEIARIRGIPVEEVDLFKFTVPEAAVNRLTAINDFYNSPRAQSQVMDLFNQYSQLFKGFVLAFPSRHVRDMYSNAFSVWLEVGDVYTTNWGFHVAKKILGGDFGSASDLLREIPGYNIADDVMLRRKLVEDVASSGVLDSLASNDLLTASRSAEMNQIVPGIQPLRKWADVAAEFVPGKGDFTGRASDLLSFRGVKVPGLHKYKQTVTRNPLLNASQKFSDYTDSVARLGGFIAMLKKGATPSFAGERITSALVNYQGLTDIERNLFRVIFPWWAYNSRIGKYVVENIARNPGGLYAQTIRGMNTLQAADEETYIPESIRQQFAIRVPKALEPYLGIEPDSRNTTFLKDFDIPGMDVLTLFSPKPTPYGTVQSTANNLGLQMNPLLRTAAELMTDQDFFSRRPLEEANTPLDRVYNRLSGSTTGLDPLVRSALGLIPGPRVGSIVGPLFDDRIPSMTQRLIKLGVNTAAGIKQQTADPEWILAEQKRNNAEYLKGFMSNYTQEFIPAEVLPQVPPELLPRYFLHQELNRDLRNARKARAGAQ